MPQIQFEESSTPYSLKNSGSYTPKIIVFLKKTGIAKNDTQASIIAIIFALIIIAISVYLGLRAMNSNAHPVIKNNLSAETIQNLPVSIQQKMQEKK